MKYPLTEGIGNPDLLVGREKEFAEFDEWVDGIPRQISKSRVILARRKSGKTVFVQRIFNRLWNENGEVVPFFISMPETKIWYTDFAVDYYCKFASQYISFLERDESLADMPMTLDQLKEYALAESVTIIARDTEAICSYRETRNQFLVWQVAFTAPKRFAKFFNRKTLVIIDEFQNISQYVYPDEALKTDPIETLAGSFHDVSESKIAPMLVTGSYVGWLVNLMNRYLEAGRLKQIYMDPYLTPEEGLQAVYKYAEVRNEPVTNETAVQINELCGSDPFFISCVMQSRCKDRNLTTREGVLTAVNYEISDRKSEMSMTWGEYIEQTVESINDVHARNMLLHLSKHPDRDWTHRELKKEVCPDMEEKKVLGKLKMLAESDLIRQGVADIQFRGLRDGTLCLILRNRFEMEIGTFEPPDLRPDFRRELEQLKKDKERLRGMLSSLVGKFAEFQLMTEFRSRQHFSLSDFFEGVRDRTRLDIRDARLRVKIQRPDGKEMEIDVLAESACGRSVLVEVKKTEDKTGVGPVRKFAEKTEVYKKLFPKKKILPAFLSVGGFTRGAGDLCRKQGIGTAHNINFLLKI